MSVQNLIDRTETRRRLVSETLDDGRRGVLGQFFTPPPVAEFLASLLNLPHSGRLTVLDAGAGVGSLSAAVVASTLRQRPALDVHVVAFEIDDQLIPHLRTTLADCEETAARAGSHVTTEVRHANFVEWASDEILKRRDGAERFSVCVLNPPYRKINVGSDDRRALERVGLRVSNVYPGFVALAAALLEPDGQLSAITPRSFANGPYFTEFRRFFLERMTLKRLHVFDRRGEIFADAGVLQENVVFHATKSQAASRVTLSVSAGYADEPVAYEVGPTHVVRPDDPHRFIHIPLCEDATALAEAIADLPAALEELSLQVSTGRVVDFRVRAHLIHDPDPASTVPLIYPSHLREGGVQWPVLDGRKPNALERCDATSALLLPAGVYVLVKRFTAKEERRRVVACVIRREDIRSDAVAFENHLNVYHRDGAGLPLELAAGLAAFLNSTMVDDYVRQFSGHTQINATDLRMLRYPSRRQLSELGRAVLAERALDQDEIDRLVSHSLAVDLGHAETELLEAAFAVAGV